MFVQRQSGRITVWWVVFQDRVPGRLCNLLIPGHFKHVAAFGYSTEARTWVSFDPDYHGTDILLVPEHDGDQLIHERTQGASVLRIDVRKLRGPNFRLGSCCTTAVRDLIGLPGRGLFSMIPDLLYRDCLRAGAVEICGAPLCVEGASELMHIPDHGIEPARR